MSIVIPRGQSRTGIALPDGAQAAVGARLGFPRLTALLALASYLACLVTIAATAWTTRGHRLAGTFDAQQLWQLSWAATAAALAATATWSHRVTSSARRHGVPGARPARAAATWFVPIIGPPAAIRQIGRLVRELDYSERRLWFWLYALYAHTAVTLAGSIVIAIGFDAPSGVAVIDAVRRQTNVLWLQTAMTALLTALAARAILHADRAIERP